MNPPGTLYPTEKPLTAEERAERKLREAEKRKVEKSGKQFGQEYDGTYLRGVRLVSGRNVSLEAPELGRSENKRTENYGLFEEEVQPGKKLKNQNWQDDDYNNRANPTIRVGPQGTQIVDTLELEDPNDSLRGSINKKSDDNAGRQRVLPMNSKQAGPAEPNQILLYLFSWSETAAKYLRYAPEVDGGWERWAQVDFYFYLRDQGIMAALEQYVYRDKKIHVDKKDRLDAWVYVDNSRQDLLELKAWSETGGQELKKLVRDVRADVNKLRSAAFDARYDGGYVWAIGIITRSVLLKAKNKSGKTYEKFMKSNMGSRDDEAEEREKNLFAENILRDLVKPQPDEETILDVCTLAGGLMAVYWTAMLHQGHAV